MTFIHGYLLAGLVLVGVPILLHLIMRQKPKQLIFPAFRFLRQKARINQRKIRLQHWLLLALRMLLIAALCFALARPRLASSRIGIGGEQTIRAVFVFDTSASMEYTVGDTTTRLDDAKRRAREILDEFSGSSEVAVFDTADTASDDSDPWLSGSALRARIDGLRIRPANAPVNRQLERAYRLLQQLGDAEDAPSRFLFVFSDRTRESWDASAAKKMQPLPGVNTVYVDVGVENPKDLSIDKVEVEPLVVAPGGRIRITATVRATGDALENELSCQFDPDPNGDRQPDKQAVKFVKGESASRVVTFDRIAPSKPNGVKEAAFHVVVKLGTNDALALNNVRYATFLVRDPRKVLTVVRSDAKESQEEVRVWRATLRAVGTFQGDVKALADAEQLTGEQLRAYHVVCLYQLPQLSSALWQRLRDYVQRDGRGLVIVPGGEELLRKVDDTTALAEFNKEGLDKKLLPGQLLNLVTVAEKKSGVPWTSFSPQHAITAPFNDWSRTSNPEFIDPDKQPRTNRYWVVKPVEGEAVVIASYADQDTHPALLERQLGRGHVVLLTTQLGRSEEARDRKEREWQTYWETYFGFLLIDRICSYLAGESSQVDLNYLCGQPVTAPMPPAPFAPPFTLQGPGLTQSETAIPTADNSPNLAITQTLGPGNFTVVDGKQQPVAGFSLNVRGEEYNLDRIPVDDIEATLGKDTVLAPDRNLKLHEMLTQRWSPPIELLPYLMMFLLLALTVESLLANFFYRRQTPAPGPEPAGVVA